MDKPDIVAVVENHVPDLHQRGGKYWGLCPFHDERTPSFTVDPDKQLFYCFGCHKGGDVIAFVQKLRSLSFPQALEYLGIKSNKPWQPDPRETRKREFVEAFREWERDYRNHLFDALLTTSRLSLTNMDEVEEFAPLLQEITDVERELTILTAGNDEDKFQLFREATGGNI